MCEKGGKGDEVSIITVVSLCGSLGVLSLGYFTLVVSSYEPYHYSLPSYFLYCLIN